ncbi:MAG: hypothetical protein QM778_11700 [Myxococcales bacterium]
MIETSSSPSAGSESGAAAAEPATGLPESGAEGAGAEGADARRVTRSDGAEAQRFTRWDVLGWIVALATACVVAFSFGLNYGINNQVVYLVSALRMVTPGILNQDWFAAHTTHYHPAYTYLSALLLWLDASGLSVAIADVVLMVAGMLFTYRAAIVLAGRRLALPIYLLLSCFAYQTRTQGTGSSYIFAGFFQPSSVGSLGLLAALPYWLEGRFLASGICLALGGLFHANYLLLGFPVFGFAHILLGRRELFPRLLRQLGPSCVSMLLLSPLIFASIGAPEGEVANQLYFHMRSPHHYEPASYERAFSPMLGFQVLGLGAGLWLLSDGRKRTARFAALLAGLSALLWTGTALTTATYVRQVAQLFVWRFAPFADFWWQMLICYALVLGFSDPAGMRRRFGDPALGLAWAGLGFLLMFFGDRKDARMVALLVALTAGFALCWLMYGLTLLLKHEQAERALGKWQRVAPVLAVLVALLGFAKMVNDPAQRSRRFTSNMPGYPAAEMEMLHWMRDKTPKDAQFLSPPDMEAVRYHGQRAIVVDWKSTPIIPHDLVAWRDRVADVVGVRPQQLTARDLSLYDTMDQRRLDRLKAKYHLNYAIVRRGRERGLAGTVAFQNRSFVVLKL